MDKTALIRKNEMFKSPTETGSVPNTELPKKPILDNANCGDKIIMQIYGLQPPGSDISNDFYVMLKNKLNDKVIEVLSVMIQRKSKLTPQDVSFLQRPQSKCTFTLHFKISAKIDKYIASFMCYLRQNLLSGGSIVEPRYTNPEICFKDYDDDGKITEGCFFPFTSLPASEIFVYNGGRGHKELACIALSHFPAETNNQHAHEVV